MRGANCRTGTAGSRRKQLMS